MTTAILADDEPQLGRALAAALAAQWPALQVLQVARNGIEAAECITRLMPDIAFLDIQMPGLTGLEVAQGIEGKTRVVFVTAFDQFAVQAFDQEAVDYVLKPVQPDRLARTIERVKRALEIDLDSAALATVLRRLQPPAQPAAANPGAGSAAAPTPLRWVRAGQGELTHQIDVKEVLFFHADDKYTCVQTAQAEHLIRTPITELAQALDPAQFWQVHRSTIVNLQHLAGTRRDDSSRLFLRIKGVERELPVSRAYVHLFKVM
jgi:DNA-binding LytR/AlgR family response regulator